MESRNMGLSENYDDNWRTCYINAYDVELDLRTIKNFSTEAFAEIVLFSANEDNVINIF